MSTRSQLTNDLNESVKTHLGKHVKILLKTVVRMETKSDKTDNRVLVFSPVRVFVLTAKIPTRIDSHFHYLDIQSVESKKGNHLMLIVGEKVYSFFCGEDPEDSSECDNMLGTLAQNIRNIFPNVPLSYIIRKIDVVPVTRIQNIIENEPRNSGPCGGFSTQYACMCDYHGLPYRDEVAWDVDTIYLSQDTRELNLKDFDHLDQKDIVPIISALEYNMYFTSLKASHTRLSHETLERIIHVLKRSLSLERIVLDSLGVRAEFIHKLATAIISNSDSLLHTIDLSHNLIEDKGALHLSGPIAKVNKGLIRLNLSHCGLTSKGINQIAHSFSLNKAMSDTLTHLDLSGNNLKDDINNLCNFLAQPNVITHLDISSTDTTLESLFGALLRGCATSLEHLNVSKNLFSSKKGKEVPPSFKQFFTSTLSLKYMNVSYCKLPLEALKHLLLGLACNESTADVHLDLSCNSFGSQGAHVLESCIHGVRCISSLDISDNNMDVELAPVLTAISKNKSIRTLFMGRSMSNLKPKHITVIMDALVSLIQQEDCALQHLHIPDSKLKSDLHNLINALGSNQCLLTLDISGNYMGDTGARLLAKALQINSRLRNIIYDKNGITLQGYSDLAYALENNYSVRYMPFPIHDISPCVRSSPDRIDAVMRKIQELLHRNVSPKKYTNGQAFRLQQSFMLSSTQQMVDRLLSQTRQSLQSLSEASNENDSRPFDFELAKSLLADAEGSKQVLPRLHDIVIRRDEQNAIEHKLRQSADEMQEVLSSFLQGSLESMVRCAIDSCPSILTSNECYQDLIRSGRHRAFISPDFIKTTIVDQAGAEIMNRVNEVNLSMAAHVSDRVTDEVMESLSRIQRVLSNPGCGLDLSDVLIRPNTPDVLRPRGPTPTIPRRPIDTSPTATPHMASKRKSLHGRKVRPKSVLDGLGVFSLDSRSSGTPDLVPHKVTQQSHDRLDRVAELPSTSYQLQHLVKGRPKRTKNKAPTRPLLASDASTASDLGEGLDQFFQPGSVTPSSATPQLTPLASPTSEGCSSLSLAESLRDDTAVCTSSGDTTPTLDVSKKKSISDLYNSAPRSLSIDNLENRSPIPGRYSLGSSPVTVPATTFSFSDHKGNDPDKQSGQQKNAEETSTDGPAESTTKSSESVSRNGSGCSVWARSNPAIKPRPWSVGGDRQNSDFQFYDEQISPTSHNNDSLLMDSMDNELTGINKNMVGTATGGSILGISPGTIGTSLVGGSIVGITPGAALERRSVKELAAGLNRVENPRDVPSKSNENIPRKPISKNKLITARFEETLAEALQQPTKRSVARHSILRDIRDSVDV